MIPKKIHYCWFSDEPYSDLVSQCIESWKKHLADYVFVKWDMNSIKDIDSVWLKECIKVRKWAFAADYVRLWAVYHEGGIYLDSDVEISDSLDSFLQEEMFIGREGIQYPTLENGVKVFLTSHCFGAIPNHPFVKLCLEYYQDRHFICSSSPNIPNGLRYDMTMMPLIQCSLAECFGYDARIHADYIQRLSNGVTVYPTRFFGTSWSPGIPVKNYASHWGAGSWRDPGLKESAPGPKKYTLWYKIKWRLKYALEWLLALRNYVLVKIPNKNT